ELIRLNDALQYALLYFLSRCSICARSATASVSM
ncbi:MAG: hypothetical protein ACI915_005182, partial [Gammaproteobacteria bacterium]